MRRMPLFVCAASLMFVGASTSVAFAQLSPTADWATHAQNEYAVAANITYLTASGYESKLDIYRRRDVQTPQPTLVFYHGGGWIGGTKEASFMSIMPWLEMGWNVVNVEYRMARVAEAPAALEDAMCALRYVVNNAKNNNIDTNKIVVSGESAGGHLALAVGMIPATAGFTAVCAGGGFTGKRDQRAEGCRDHQLVRHYRRERHACRAQCASVRRAVGRKREEPRRCGEGRLADDLRARRPAADSQYPGRR